MRVPKLALKVRWTGPDSWQEALEHLFAETSSPDCGNFFCLTPAEALGLHDSWWNPHVPVTDWMTPGEQKSYEHYRARFPDKYLWDLSQKGDGSFARGERVDGTLPTLTTNSSMLFSSHHNRVLIPEELIMSQGIPATAQSASYCGLQRWPFKEAGVPYSAMVSMAGNGMHVPTMGAFVLMSMTYAEKLVMRT